MNSQWGGSAGWVVVHRRGSGAVTCGRMRTGLLSRSESRGGWERACRIGATARGTAAAAVVAGRAVAGDIAAGEEVAAAGCPAGRVSMLRNEVSYHRTGFHAQRFICDKSYLRLCESETKVGVSTSSRLRKYDGISDRAASSGSVCARREAGAAKGPRS